MSIEPSAAQWESFHVGSKVVMYFGPFPGFLRLIPNLLFPELSGHWSRLSLLFASALILIALYKTLQVSFTDSTIGIKEKNIFTTTSWLGFALGTPLLFLMSCGFIYHEANIWGLCWAVWGVYFLMRIVTTRGQFQKNLLGLSVAAGFALLSRVTFSVPLMLSLGILFLVSQLPQLRDGRIQISFGKFFLYTLPASCAVVFQLWYNYARFGSILTFADYTKYVAALDQSRKGIEQLGGMMNLKRIPIALWDYVRILPSYFTAHAPYLRLQAVTDFPMGLYPRGFDGGAMMNVISILLVSPWIIIGAAAGLRELIKSKKYLELSFASAFCVQVLFVLSYYWIATRYSSEFLPLFLFCYLFFLRLVVVRQPRFWTSLIGSFVAFSIITTSLSTMEYVTHYRKGIPQEYIARIKGIFDSF